MAISFCDNEVRNRFFPSLIVSPVYEIAAFLIFPLPFDRAWIMNSHKEILTLTEGLDHYSNTPINKQQTPKPPFKNSLILKLHTNEGWFD